MVGVKNQCCLASEHGCIHAAHTIHLHHLLHSSVFLRKNCHRCYILIFELFNFNIKLLIAKLFAEDFNKAVCCLLEFFLLIFCNFILQRIMYICINSQELNFLMFLLKVCDKCRINVMCQNDRILSLGLEHVDVLALLYFICYIEDSCLLFFLRICVLRLFCVCFCFFCLSFLCLGCVSFFAFGFFDDIFESHVFMIKILVKHRILHLLTEFLIFQATELDKWTDVIPIFLIVLTVCLEHSIQLVSNLLGNVISNFIYKSVVLQCTT